MKETERIGSNKRTIPAIKKRMLLPNGIVHVVIPKSFKTNDFCIKNMEEIINRMPIRIGSMATTLSGVTTIKIPINKEGKPAKKEEVFVSTRLEKKIYSIYKPARASTIPKIRVPIRIIFTLKKHRRIPATILIKAIKHKSWASKLFKNFINGSTPFSLLYI